MMLSVRVIFGQRTTETAIAAAIIFGKTQKN